MKEKKTAKELDNKWKKKIKEWTPIWKTIINPNHHE